MSRIAEVRERFNDEFSYSLVKFSSDYLSELERFDLNKWEAPQRAARLSAAVKNYKTSEMLIFVLRVAEEMELDITPLTIKRLNNAFFGRTGSQNLIVAIFGDSIRSHRSADSNPERIKEIELRFRKEAVIFWEQTMSQIRSVQNQYKMAVKKEMSKRE